MLTHKFEYTTDTKLRFNNALTIFEQLESLLESSYGKYGCEVSFISTEGYNDYTIELRVAHINDASLWDEIFEAARFILEELIY